MAPEKAPLIKNALQILFKTVGGLLVVNDVCFIISIQRHTRTRLKIGLIQTTFFCSVTLLETP